ncbi:MAG: protoporphyrinogen oxidase [Omnitrophica bacterium GWA2_52_12]|nr:MAG: protoporphyrinogen oxidase [Omnitrophica bacterium GWA2_52_12]
MAHLKKVAILGGGISGLAAAHRLFELSDQEKIPLEITILEAAPRLGGVIETVTRAGFQMESGPDMFITERPAALNLSRRLNLEPELLPVTQEHSQSYVLYRGKLRPIPRGFYLMASGQPALLWSLPFIGPLGKARMLLEPWVPVRRDTGDESVGSFIRRRFGAEALKRIGQPMIGGIYTADPDRLSLQATFPKFLEMEREHRSVIRALAKNKAAAAASGPRYQLFTTYRKGMQTLIEALQTKISGRARILTGRCVSEMAPHAGGWKIRCAGFPDMEADAVMLALPVRQASRLLQTADAVLGRAVGEIESESAATIHFAYRKADVPGLPHGAGFVVPLAEGGNLVGATLTHQKFAGRAPEDGVLIRAFAGGFGRGKVLELADEALIETVKHEIEKICAINAQPLFTSLKRYAGAMPQYAVGHAERVGHIRKKIERLNGIFLTGNYLRGVGIPDCVHESEDCADKLLRWLMSRT